MLFPALIRLWLVIVALWHVYLPTLSLSAAQPSGQKYLLPLLPYGPSNQIVAFKEALSLAALLNVTVISYGIFNHNSEAEHVTEEYGGYHIIPLDHLYNRSKLQEVVRIVTIQELEDQGWDRTVDAVLAIRADYQEHLQKLSINANVSTASFKVLGASGFRCEQPHQLTRVERLMQPYNHIALYSYRKVLGGARRPNLNFSSHPLDPCLISYKQVCKHMTKTNELQNIASAFIQRHLYNSSYVAVHVRPFPDECLHIWEKPVYDQARADKECFNPLLKEHMVSKAQEALLLYGLKTVFVMAHPSIRHHITESFSAAGIMPVYQSLDTLPTSYKNKWSAVTFLSMVEQEISVRSEVFIGSGTSSMTVNVIQERTAQDVPHEKTMYV